MSCNLRHVMHIQIYFSNHINKNVELYQEMDDDFVDTPRALQANRLKTNQKGKSLKKKKDNEVNTLHYLQLFTTLCL